MKLLMLLCLWIVFFLPVSSMAGCPPGTYQTSTPNVVYCAPLPGQPAGQALGPEWLSQWGAIAYGGGGFGASRGMGSKRKAEKTALRQCQGSGGGKQCKVAYSYSNQCVAYAIGQHYFVGIGRGAEQRHAERDAHSICAGGDNDCRVTYSACSYPAQVIR